MTKYHLRSRVLACLLRVKMLTLAIVLAFSLVAQVLVAAPVHADDNFAASITAMPTEPTIDTTPTFEFTTTYDESPFTFRCYIDNLSIGDCVSPFTVADLEPGEHTFYIGLANNFSVFSPVTPYTWTINTESEGDGTAEFPLAISDCADLHSMEANLSAYYTLHNDIDCEGFNYTPVGEDWAAPFTGVLNGDGYTIANLTITGNSECGIFGNAEQATVLSLHVDSMQNLCTGNYNGQIVGAATGMAMFDVVATNGSIPNTSGLAGGLIGGASGSELSTLLERCSSEAVITSSSIRVGGLVGGNQSQLHILDSYSSGSISGLTIGGLVGEVNSGSLFIERSYSANELTNINQNESIYGLTGGLVGFTGLDTNIANSFSASDMQSNDSNHTQIGGIVANINEDSNITSSGNYFDSTLAGTTACSEVGTIACTAKTDSNYFLGNSTNEPMSAWAGPWNMHEPNQYPTFTIGSVVCDDPESMPATAVLFGCQFSRQNNHKYSGNAVAKQVRYRVHGSDQAWTYQDWPTYTMKVLITGLSPNTQYDVQLHTNWEFGASDWEAATAQLTTGSSNDTDTDGDGIKDSIEVSGPNMGDANGDHDGTEGYADGDDYTQANVTSLKNSITGNYVVLQSNCAANLGVSMQTESTDHKDTAYDFALGLMNFTATGCGSTATFTQYFYGDYDAAKYSARKYNPATHAYTSIPGAVLSSVTINGQKALKIVYQIADNGALDDNKTTGTITDPSGPALAVIGVPNTGLYKN